MKILYACSVVFLSALALGASAQARPAKRVASQSQPASAQLRGGGPANDICADAPVHALTAGSAVVITGTNVGATLDEPALTDTEGNEYPAVWEAITVPACMDITVAYCGSAFEGTVFTGMFSDCDFGGIVRAFTTENTSCSDGRITITYRRVPQGTYLIPVASDPLGTDGAYTITVLGTACADPVAANDDCAGGPVLAVNSNCVVTTVDMTGASQSLPAATCSGFEGTADDDVWFRFEATGSAVRISAQGDVGYDAVLEIFEGTCSGLVSLGCVDNSLDGEVEVAQVTDLEDGSTYYLRVYDWYTGLPAGTGLSVCVVEVPTVTNNDECPGTPLTMGDACVPVTGTMAGATESQAAIECNDFIGAADDDVWHSFVATSSMGIVAAQGGSDLDMVLELLAGPCGSGASLACSDTSVANGVEQILFTDFAVGTTYYVRLYSYAAEPVTDPTYQICVVAIEAPENDECANAIAIDVNEPFECPDASVIGDNSLATVSSAAPECDESVDGFQDLWYSFNSLGNTLVTLQFSNFSMEDAGVEVLDGCSGTSLFCDFGAALADPIAMDVEANTEYLVRVYSNLDFGAGGEFGLCVSAALSTAVEEVSTETWSVFPNPNDGRFQISNAGEAMNASVELFDATGRLVLSDRVVLAKGGVQAFDQAGRLAPGTYALRLTSGDVRTEQRVMVR